MQKIAIDTNIFIYHFNHHEEFGKKASAIFQKIEKRQASAVTSILTLTELLALSASSQEIEEIQSDFLQTPELEIIDFTQTIAIEAGRIRREYGFRTSDAMQLATALYAKADIFITNDKRLEKFKEIKIKLLSK